MESSDDRGDANATSAASVTHGNVARVQNGDAYDQHKGNARYTTNGNLNSIRKGWSNTLVEGFTMSFTLGACVSTIGGAYVAATGALDVGLTAVSSTKAVFGGDVEVSQATQYHSTGPRVYDFNRTSTYQATTWQRYDLCPGSDALFARKVRQYFPRLEAVASDALEYVATRVNQSAAGLNMLRIGTDWRVEAGDHRVFTTDGARLATSGEGAVLDVQAAGITIRGGTIELQGNLIRFGP